VTYNSSAGTVTWTNLDGNTGPIGDLPTTDIVRDDVTGRSLRVHRLRRDDAGRRQPGERLGCSGAGFPNVAVAGLTIVPGARKPYAATHGRSAWSLMLP
jgi:hypothetical protein